MNEIKISLSAYDFNQMACYTIRYCLEHSSYGTYDGQQFLLKYWHLLSSEAKTEILQAISEWLAEFSTNGQAFVADIIIWKNLLNWFKDQKDTPQGWIKLPVISQEKCNAKQS
ncbi:hypothetical protein [Lonepinella sp. BR2904]|uniref:hypothetical protein n=1 Tax=Lonepinella sp. BR2904 TaxID=3434551 RepID=UPI003F6E02E6